MERPLGVTILAILHFIGVFFAICAGLLMILGMGFFAAALARAANIGSGGAGIIAGLGVVLAIFAFIGAAISGLIGWGLWNLKNWARITAMVFAVLGMLGGVGSLMFALTHFNPFFLSTGIVRAAIAVLIFWYLNQPHVKTAFGATQTSVASA